MEIIILEKVSTEEEKVEEEDMTAWQPAQW